LAKDYRPGNPELASFTDDIFHGRSSDIRLPFYDSPEPSSSPEGTAHNVSSKLNKNSPGGQYVHKAAGYLSVILEVSYAQKRKSLAYLADGYIVGSEGDIQSVIGLDIEYGGSKLTIFSVLRPTVSVNEQGEHEGCSEKVLGESPFGSADGTPMPGELRILLQDFSPAEYCPKGTNELAVCVEYTKLAPFLSHAEEQHQLRRSIEERQPPTSGIK
jgi:hypothetical protein